MSDTPNISIATGDSMVLALARRVAAETLAELERTWRYPQPDAVVAAARRHLAAAENWADARREGV